MSMRFSKLPAKSPFYEREDQIKEPRWAAVRRRFDRVVLVVLVLLGLLTLFCTHGCGNPIQGGNPAPSHPLHFRIHVYNQDIAAAETASICWWVGSAFVGSRDQLVPAGGKVTFDLGTAKPDGLQVVMGTARAFNGLIQGPGGLVLQSPDYKDTFDVGMAYPFGQVWDGP